MIGAYIVAAIGYGMAGLFIFMGGYIIHHIVKERGRLPQSEAAHKFVGSLGFLGIAFVMAGLTYWITGI